MRNTLIIDGAKVDATAAGSPRVDPVPGWKLRGMHRVFASHSYDELCQRFGRTVWHYLPDNAPVPLPPDTPTPAVHGDV